MKRVILVFSLCAMCLLSCKKKEGCIDRHAYNFDEESEIDDGSCKYKMQCQIWMSEVTAQAIKDDGVSNLYFQFGDIRGVILDSLNWPIGHQSFGEGFVLDWEIPLYQLPAAVLSVNKVVDGEVQEDVVDWHGFEIEQGAKINQEVMYP